MKAKTLSAIALSLLNEGVSFKAAAKKLGVKHQWLVAAVQRPNPNFRFGVEIETDYDGNLDNYLPPEFNVFYQVEYHEDTDDIDGFDINNQYDWRQMYDGSLSSDSNYSEYVSPILQGDKGFKILEQFCKGLNRAGAGVDRSCGLHVHIDRNHFDGDAHVARFVRTYMLHEEAIDLMMPSSRRESKNDYCVSISNGFGSRSCKVNTNNKATVEVRHHAGTINYLKIHNWILILSRLIEASRTEVRVSTFESILGDKLSKYYHSRVAVLA